MSSNFNPGAFFIATLKDGERKYFKNLFQKARAAGYSRFVEPCAGAFAMSHLAAQAGWKTTEISASDVTLFTSVMGYAITGESLGPFGITADGYENEDLTDPATVLWVQLCLRTSMKAGHMFFYDMLTDLHRRKEKHIEKIRGQLDRAQKVLGGMQYRPLCLWKHLDECLDDPKAIVVINPPTYAAGFEKWYDTGNRLRWKEPEYAIFDPVEGMRLLGEKANAAKALVLCYEQSRPGETACAPVFGRAANRDGLNAYLTANREEEVKSLANGGGVLWAEGNDLQPLDYPILPQEHPITADSTLNLFVVPSKNATYYRKLLTHGFVGSRCSCNLVLLIDGYVAGVLGYDVAALTIGAFGGQQEDALFIMYAMTVPRSDLRLVRLLKMLALNKCYYRLAVNDLILEKVKIIKTVVMTRKPEAKGMRGIMKLVGKNPDRKTGGYRLTYVAPAQDRTPTEILKAWLEDENKLAFARKQDERRNEKERKKEEWRAKKALNPTFHKRESTSVVA